MQLGQFVGLRRDKVDARQLAEVDFHRRLFRRLGRTGRLLIEQLGAQGRQRIVQVPLIRAQRRQLGRQRLFRLRQRLDMQIRQLIRLRGDEFHLGQFTEVDFHRLRLCRLRGRFSGGSRLRAFLRGRDTRRG